MKREKYYLHHKLTWKKLMLCDRILFCHLGFLSAKADKKKDNYVLKVMILQSSDWDFCLLGVVARS
jgi:hypothetical protein